MNKYYFLIIGISISVFSISCYDQPDPLGPQESSEPKPFYNSEELRSDTMPIRNYTDRNGLRQGYWRITGAMVTDSVYRNSGIVREGIYVDSKEEGMWMEYTPQGTLKRKVNYSRGVEVK